MRTCRATLRDKLIKGRSHAPLVSISFCLGSNSATSTMISPWISRRHCCGMGPSPFTFSPRFIREEVGGHRQAMWCLPSLWPLIWSSQSARAKYCYTSLTSKILLWLNESSQENNYSPYCLGDGRGGEEKIKGHYWVIQQVSVSQRGRLVQWLKS